jgi:hypothetical protein
MYPPAEPFDDGGAGPNLVTNLSGRAAAVIITMIAETGQRGAVTIEVNDLVIALIAEDHDPHAFLLFRETPPGVLLPPKVLQSSLSGKQREPFFPSKVAVDVLIKLNQILPRSAPFPTGTRHNTSAALDRVLARAQKLPSELNQAEVKVSDRSTGYKPEMRQGVVPLDLLAAALEEPCEATQMLQEAGITEEKVLRVIRAGGDLENGSVRLGPL